MTDDQAPAPFGQTPWQTVGPFFHFSLPWDGSADIVADGSVVEISGQVRDGEGRPVPDAMVETWQSDPAGFGRACTGEDGTWRLRTVRPVPVPGPGNRSQAPHIAVGVLGRGLIKRLVTRIYFEDAPENDDDPVLGLVPPERRSTLIARRASGSWRFDIVLQGTGETVFFDI